MVRQGHHQKTVDIPRHSNGYNNSNKKDFQSVKLQKNLSKAGNGVNAPKMMGNIGFTKKNAYVDPDEIDNDKKHIFRKLAEEFDIDNVIPLDE